MEKVIKFKKDYTERLPIVLEGKQRPQTERIEPKVSESQEYLKEKLKNYKQLESYELLRDLVPFKNWIRYYSRKDRKFRAGGLFMGADPDLEFVTLMNSSTKFKWKVLLNEDNIIFISKTPMMYVDDTENTESEW